MTGTFVMLARIFTALLFFAFCSTAGATEAAWAKLADGGYTVLIAHTHTQGTGDPAIFKLGDCSTQRNLSGRGRQEAQRMGARLDARAVAVDKVLTSQWCRTHNTAEIMFRDVKIEEFPALNSLSAEGADREAQSEAVLKQIRSFYGPGNQVMITHPENIEALTGRAPRPREAIIVTATENGINIAARLILH